MQVTTFTLQMFMNLLLAFGGIVLFIIGNCMFKTSSQRIYKIFRFIVCLMPVLGFLSELGIFLWCTLGYSKSKPEQWELDNCKEPVVEVRNTALNHWLFNKIDWDSYKKNEHENVPSGSGKG